MIPICFCIVTGAGGEHGLVNRLTEPGGALAEAHRLADALLVNGPLALAASVRIMRATHDWSDAEAWPDQDAIAAPLRDSVDRAEGLRAFAERRQPVWKGNRI